MEQEIGFCAAADDVNIAYATLGTGPAVVYVAGWPGNLQKEWETDFAREFLTSLSQGVRLIRYDMRGSGLSDRDTIDFSPEALQRDLAAVADHLGLEEFALLALGFFAGPLAISYAAANPARVTALIISSGFLRGEDLAPPERARAVIEYIRTSGFPSNISNVTEGTEEQYRGAARILKDAATREVQAQVMEQMLRVDVSDIAATIKTPTLVIHGRQDSVVRFINGRRLASQIPRSKFVPHEDNSATPWRNVDLIGNEMRAFIGVEVDQTVAAAGDIHTILFTDVEGSTALTERLGDAKARELLREHERIVREALKVHGGSEVKTLGDGFMASFGSATKALECAIAIQKAFDERNRSLPVHPEALEGRAEPIKVRIGLNAGEPIAEDEDLFGTAVNMAARIAAKADAGEILASNVVRELVAGKEFLFSDR
ncbi:MAG: adenylate/guanylate cyclase domain-containing protein, partial [Gemmatimonadota bacterium]